MFAILLIFLNLFLSVWIYRDSLKNGSKHPLVWALFVVFMPFIAYPVYLLSDVYENGIDGFLKKFNVLGLIVFVVLCFCIANANFKTDIEKNNSVDKVDKEVVSETVQVKQPYEIVDTHIDNDKYDNRIYTGKFIANKDFKTVYIELKVYDKNHNVIGYTNDAIHNLKANETWQFKMDIDHITKEKCSVSISKVNVY